MMNLNKIEITENQKKIIIMGAITALVFLLFLVFFYLPASKEIQALKNELISTDSQIQSIETLLSGSGTRDEATRLLKERQQYLNNKFPNKEEESLRLIPEFARKNNIEVISLQPGAKTEFLAEDGKPHIIEGRTAYYLPMTMEISCSYKDLVAYLLELKSYLPVFVSVINLNVRKESQSANKVRATVTFNLYLLV